jgi:predicted transposase YbfD/YdcC
VDLAGKLVVLDALHTHPETARQVVQDLGADYLLSVKANQAQHQPKGLECEGDGR